MKNASVKNILVVILFITFIFVVVKQFSRSSTPPSGRSEERKARKAALGEIIDLNLDLLEPRAIATREDGRNIFRYYTPPPPKPKPTPPPPQPTAEELAQRKIAQQQRQKEMEQAREERAKPKPPSITFKYLGSFGPETRMLAVFSNDGEILDVFEGEEFMDKYILQKIGMESVTVGFVGFDAEENETIQVGS